MKKSILKVALATSLAFIMPSVSNAQLGDILKSAAGTAVQQATGNSTITNVVTTLLGTSNVTEKSIVGTWTYQEPCIAAESSNVLTKTAAAASTSLATLNTLLKNVDGLYVGLQFTK